MLRHRDNITDAGFVAATEMPTSHATIPASVITSKIIIIIIIKCF